MNYERWREMQEQADEYERRREWPLLHGDGKRRKAVYKITRMFFNGASQVISWGLTLEEAQRHCQDPET